MTPTEPSKMTDQHLLAEAKTQKKAPLMNAFFIGAMFGIIVYGVVKNGLGFFMLIPLFLIYRMTRKSTGNKVLEELKKERDLK